MQYPKRRQEKKERRPSGGVGAVAVPAEALEAVLEEYRERLPVAGLDPGVGPFEGEPHHLAVLVEGGAEAEGVGAGQVADELVAEEAGGELAHDLGEVRVARELPQGLVEREVGGREAADVLEARGL